jgi:hypothetical protein
MRMQEGSCSGCSTVAASRSAVPAMSMEAFEPDRLPCTESMLSDVDAIDWEIMAWLRLMLLPAVQGNSREGSACSVSWAAGRGDSGVCVVCVGEDLLRFAWLHGVMHGRTASWGTCTQRNSPPCMIATESGPLTGVTGRSQCTVLTF